MYNFCHDISWEPSMDFINDLMETGKSKAHWLPYKSGLKGVYKEGDEWHFGRLDGDSNNHNPIVILRLKKIKSGEPFITSWTV